MLQGHCGKRDDWVPGRVYDGNRTSSTDLSRWIGLALAERRSNVFVAQVPLLENGEHTQSLLPENVLFYEINHSIVL